MRKNTRKFHSNNVDTDHEARTPGFKKGTGVRVGEGKYGIKR